MVKQTAKVISSNVTTGAQVILAGKTKFTVLYDSDKMLSYIETDGPRKFSDKELLDLVVRTTLLRVDDATTQGLVNALPVDVWALPGRTLSVVFGHMFQVDVRLDGGETLILSGGWYTVTAMNDVYVMEDWIAAKIHLEIFTGGVWRNFLVSGQRFTAFICDGAGLMRVANGAAAGTFGRMVGVRAY